MNLQSKILKYKLKNFIIEKLNYNHRNYNVVDFDIYAIEEEYIIVQFYFLNNISPSKGTFLKQEQDTWYLLFKQYQILKYKIHDGKTNTKI